MPRERIVMPRETIRTKDNNFDVQVGWSKGREIQVGVSEADGRSMWWVHGEKYVAQIGEEARRLCIESENNSQREYNGQNIGEGILNFLDVTCGSFDSLWATMNRQEINQLIRVLRRARDSAFGKDE